MKRIASFSVIIALIILWTLALRQTDQQTKPALAELPTVRYLGEGGDFNEPGLNFIVKGTEGFWFMFVPGPTVTVDPGQRVWSTDGDEAPPGVFHDWNDFGPVTAGCLIEYVGIDDDVDDRINRFYLGDDVVHTIGQGLDFSGQFTVPADGELRLYAEDSIGGWIKVCETQETPIPTNTATLPPSETPTSTSTSTNTPTVTATATDSTNTPTPTGTTTTITPTATGTVTPTPTVPIIISPSVTPPVPTITNTPTKEPRENACTRINFDVGGHVAQRGLYMVVEKGGRELASWYAEDGWQDSGWIQDIDISYPSVYVQVLYYSGPGATPVVMKMLNPAPDSEYGWMARGMCHALEVAWPENMPELPASDPNATANPVFEDGGNKSLTPVPPPLPTPTSKSSSSLLS